MHWSLQEVEGPRFGDNCHMKVVRLSALHPGHLYPHEIILVLISVRVWVNRSILVLPERLCQWKFPMTLSGIEPGNFWFVAKRNNIAIIFPPHLTRHPSTTHSTLNSMNCWQCRYIEHKAVDPSVNFPSPTVVTLQKQSVPVDNYSPP